MEISRLSPPTLRFIAALTPALVNAFTPGLYEQERGDHSEAYCDPESYEGNLLPLWL